MQISPTSPSGISLPSSSRIDTSVLGIGTPMLPVQSLMFSALQVAIGEVPVRP